MSFVDLKQMTEEEKHEQFMERINRGEKIEADDWMPDDYRMVLIKLISMHGISEIMEHCLRRNGYLKPLH